MGHPSDGSKGVTAINSQTEHGPRQRYSYRLYHQHTGRPHPGWTYTHRAQCCPPLLASVAWSPLSVPLHEFCVTLSDSHPCCLDQGACVSTGHMDRILSGLHTSDKVQSAPLTQEYLLFEVCRSLYTKLPLYATPQGNVHTSSGL